MVGVWSVQHHQPEPNGSIKGQLSKTATTTTRWSAAAAVGRIRPRRERIGGGGGGDGGVDGGGLVLVESGVMAVVTMARHD